MSYPRSHENIEEAREGRRHAPVKVGYRLTAPQDGIMLSRSWFPMALWQDISSVSTDMFRMAGDQRDHARAFACAFACLASGS